MSYRQLGSVLALVFLTLCCTVIVLPEIIYWLFNLQGNALGDFLAKRAGVLFLGLAMICFLSRDTTSHEVVRLIAISIGTAMGAMAILGVYEMALGNAGIGILVAVVTEVVIAGLFWQQWRDAQ